MHSDTHTCTDAHAYAYTHMYMHTPVAIGKVILF